MAVPRMRASMRSPAFKASDSLLSTTMPQPSPRTYPSAEASNVLQRPSGATICAAARVTLGQLASIRLTPPANAVSHSRFRRDEHARWIAVSDDEHAVSIAREGPCNPNTYETRPAQAFSAAPVLK